MSTEQTHARVSDFEAAADDAARAASLDAPARTPLLLPAASLWWREVVRFYRQRSRWVGVVLSPVLFWAVVGSGLGDSFRAGGDDGRAGYLEYFFPGTLVLTLLFTSIFCMMSVIEDRREGFLLSVLVSPAPRASIGLGKVLGGTTLAVAQGALFLLLAPLAGLRLSLT
ncbi:MAG TPA: ABC transporter permease, partial [Pyrinomonadaceae bacterium]|nr:ABC transporter permease [Pyrinomonadaceae bacterium]